MFWIVINKENGSCVYTNTERTCCGGELGIMYRYADNNKDFVWIF